MSDYNTEQADLAKYDNTPCCHYCTEEAVTMWEIDDEDDDEDDDSPKLVHICANHLADFLEG